MFIFKLRNLNITKSEKGISGFSKELGGFFIVDKNSYLPEQNDEYVEIEVVRKITDKRGKEVPIIKFHQHQHQYSIVGSNNSCLSCICGETKTHEWKVIGYEVSETDHLHRAILKCSICGKEDKDYWTRHSFETVEETYDKRIQRCACGKERVVQKAQPYVDKITIDEVLDEIENYTEWEKVRKSVYYELDKLYSVYEEKYSELKKVQEELENGIRIQVPLELQWRHGDIVDGYVKEITVMFNGERYCFFLHYYKRGSSVCLRDSFDGSVYSCGYSPYGGGYTSFPTHRLPERVKQYLDKEGILEASKKLYEEKTKKIQELEEEIRMLKEQLEEQNKKYESMKYSFKNEVIRILWEMRTDPIFPEDCYFRIENFLNFLKRLKEVR